MEEYERMSDSQFSLSTRNPFHASSMMKQRSPLETKKNMVRKKPSTTPKPKPKKVVSDKPKKSVSCKRRTRIDDLYDNIEDKCSVMERAEELLTGAEFPSFVKCMLPSNVAHGFWLIFPKSFCNLHLPKHDTTVILVDERGKEYKTNFLLERHGLSGGWRGFSMDHRLLKGDCLVFHLVEPCKLKGFEKPSQMGFESVPNRVRACMSFEPALDGVQALHVHIVRVYGLDEVDAALCLMNLDAFGKTTYYSDNTKKENRKRKKGKKRVEPLLLDIPQNYDIKNWNWSRVSNPSVELTAEDQSYNTSDGFGSEVLGGELPILDLWKAQKLCAGSAVKRLWARHIASLQFGMSLEFLGSLLLDA
ncbi:hypothetical protein LguiB_007097 [Lonicera macranthoides]